MTALRRMTVKGLIGLAATLALALGGPALGQNNDTPVDVTAAPAPSAETIGPSQLRDFNLQGTVTRPVDRPATPAHPATTASAAPRNGEAVPTEAAQPSTEPAIARSIAGRSTRSPDVRQLQSSTGIGTRTAPVTPSLPLEVTTGAAPQPGVVETPAAPALESDGGFLSLPWIAALVALIGGGAFIAWNRRSRRQRYGDPGRLAFAGLAPGDAAETEPMPKGQPRSDPLPPHGQGRVSPRPDPVPSAAPKPAAEPANDGLITSSRLKPQLNVEFHPDRVVVTEQDIQVQFDVVLANVGSAPARDVLVEGRLFTAHGGQDGEIAEFFHNPATEGDRMTSIAPLGRIALKSVARLPLDEVHRFEAAGRKLFVPLVGFNILYRAGSAESQASASFLVGRGGEDDEKLAPFRIDLGPRVFRGLSARAHSIGLQAA
jgi:hypothetical protein